MPETDPRGLPADMLHDVSLNRSRQQAGDERVAEIMRLAGSPLLLRGYLRRESPVGQLPKALRLPSPIMVPNPLPEVRTSCHRYDGDEPEYRESLHPSTFDVTPEDRAKALDGHDPVSATDRTVLHLSLVPFLSGASLLVLAVFCLML